MSNALKIEIMTSFSGDDPVYGETLYFDEDETRSILVTNNAECQILESMKQHPQVNDGSKYEDPDSQRDAHMVTVNIFHAHPSTKTNLTTLFSYKNLFKVYYKYITDPTAFYLCILDPNRSEKYTSGFEEAEIVTTLKFYETYNFKADGTAYLTNGISVTPEVIIDPDGKNIRLDGDTDIVSISPIIQSVDIEAQRTGIMTNNDMSVSICNPLNYLRSYNNSDTSTTWNPFRFVKSKVRVVYPDTVNYIGVSVDTAIYDCEMRFKVGDQVRIVNNSGEYEDKTITLIGTQSYNYGTTIQKLFFDTDLAYVHNTESVVETWSILGKKCVINLRFETEDYYGHETVEIKQIYNGVIRGNINVIGNKGHIYVESFRNIVINKPIRIKAASLTPLYRCNSAGTLVDSRVWTTQTGSGVLADLTVYNEADIGKWEITFSSATDFTVSGPNCSAKAGSTATDFYDQTDASDSQIKIASADWSGTPANGDVYGFYVSANFSATIETQIVHDLLVTYGGVSDGVEEEIVTTSGSIMTISFDESITVGGAISVIFSGSTFGLSETYDGKYKVYRISEGNYERIPPSAYTSYDGTSIKMESVIKNTFSLKSSNDIYSIVNINSAWDYENLVFGDKYIYPKNISTSREFILSNVERTIEINIPGLYASAIGVYGLYVDFYGYPQYLAEVELSIQSLLNNIEIGNTYAIPTYGGTAGLFVTEKEIDINKNRLVLRGILPRKRI